jgi:ER lumen protein retaining receptor
VITGQYMFLVGAYRLFYILKWYSRDSSRINILISTSHLQHIIKLIAAIIQLGVFLDFAYYYLKR